MAKINLIRGRETDVPLWFAVVLGEVTEPDADNLLKFCNGEASVLVIDAEHEVNLEPNW